MLSNELEIAKKLAKEAGQIVMQYYHNDYDVELKKEAEPVTLADKASNEFITGELKKHFPKDGILAEESKDDLSRLEKNRVWLVDPMDGTQEFIERIGQFAIMIGLVENGRPILGVVYQPTTRTLYYAIKQQGAFLSRNGDTQPLRISDVAEIKDMRLVISRSHRAALVDTMKNALQINKEVSSGSVGLKVGLLVETKSDLYLHPNSKTKEWDTCAPEIILQEAGGQMTDCWGEPLKYNKKSVFNEKGFVASNGRCHGEIVKKIKPFLGKLT
ncbi:3'(2'),5'-bisphosphate nucleotidase CysQ [candidate division KSB1 bacterium]|nr:3'(2'),5'-bisphosphate nucleotidase CysQ [candidate division KSB1 bacterium]NIR72115.1 3'(2'),5'-bisphosphate nucleotidase CysQ [candidate division KSB1 bacterium]NIS26057.1 3'(2'),5'-bisphosphate nucleotidase CysQ [candidate division KSB1 bacterium]NIT71948.1 3'(2'),5'-bisphosphate nucleotidase CysQ [candidate division KSB1 bacterium]NIU25692.1 3'(2'),5'-bisphosphate nucleotidase CysQ [candidate division KSB1 bacterium]